MYVERLFIGMLIFSGIIVGLNIVISDISSNYSIQGKDISYLSVSKDIEDSTQFLTTAIQSVRITDTPFDYALMAVAGLLGVFKLLLDVVTGLFTILISNVSSLLGLPIWFTSILIAITTVMIVFAIIRVLLKTKV